MKLSEVIRGVEVKGDYERLAVDIEDAYDDGLIRGYNILASAEVVVDREKLHDILLNNPECWTQDDNGEDIISFDGQAQAIATAIESGAVIGLKEKE